MKANLANLLRNSCLLASPATLFFTVSLQMALAQDAPIAFRPPVSGHAIDARQITPSDVLSRVQLLSAQLELLRRHLGLPRAKPLPIKIEQAQPREVYFQAQALYRRLDRLTFERLRQLAPEPRVLAGNDNSTGHPLHVWLHVSQSSQLLTRILVDAGISQRLTETPSDRGTRPSQVFDALLRANRQLDSMLEQPFSPSDVFQQVTQAVHYGARLLASYPVQNRIPPAPDHIEDKRPADVWWLLSDCLAIIRDIAHSRGERLLEISLNPDTTELILPGDVYQQATLVVSELAHLHAQQQDAPPVVPAPTVAGKIPADVYQRVGILHKQLTLLRTLSAGKLPAGGNAL